MSWRAAYSPLGRLLAQVENLVKARYLRLIYEVALTGCDTVQWLPCKYATDDWRKCSDDDWRKSPDEKWLKSPDANNNKAKEIKNMKRHVPFTKLKKEVNNIILIYGLCDMVNRAMTLVKYFTPNFGTEYYDVLYSCFCRHRKMADMEIMLELGMSRASFYRKKKAALRYLGYYFFEIVVPQSANKRYKPSFPETEE